MISSNFHRLDYGFFFSLSLCVFVYIEHIFLIKYNETYSTSFGVGANFSALSADPFGVNRFAVVGWVSHELCLRSVFAIFWMLFWRKMKKEKKKKEKEKGKKEVEEEEKKKFLCYFLHYVIKCVFSRPFLIFHYLSPMRRLSNSFCIDSGMRFSLDETRPSSVSTAWNVQKKSPSWAKFTEKILWIAYALWNIVQACAMVIRCQWIGPNVWIARIVASGQIKHFRGKCWPSRDNWRTTTHPIFCLNVTLTQSNRSYNSETVKFTYELTSSNFFNNLSFSRHTISWSRKIMSRELNSSAFSVRNASFSAM